MESKDNLQQKQQQQVDNHIQVFQINSHCCQCKHWRQRQNQNRKRLKEELVFNETGNMTKDSSYHETFLKEEEWSMSEELHFNKSRTTSSTFKSRRKVRRKMDRNRTSATTISFLYLMSVILVTISMSSLSSSFGSLPSWGMGVEGFVLEGTHTSYAQFQRWYPSPNSSIQFEFLTSQPDGILLYTDDGGYYDFIELKLVDGSIRLRYNLGGGARVLHAGTDLHLGDQWHSVQFIRNDSLTILKVDDEVATSLKSIIIKPQR